MSDVADAIRRKVKRATGHFEHFKAAFGVGNPTAFAVHDPDDPDDPDGNLRLTTDAPGPRIEHALIIGDAVHQLRSCLDHIVYAMAKTHTQDREILHYIQLPIFDHPASLQKSLGFRRVIRVFGESSPVSLRYL